MLDLDYTAALGRTIFDISNDALVIVRISDGTLLDANRRAEQISGRPHSELRNLNLLELIEADQPD